MASENFSAREATTSHFSEKTEPYKPARLSFCSTLKFYFVGGLIVIVWNLIVGVLPSLRDIIFQTEDGNSLLSTAILTTANNMSLFLASIVLIYFFVENIRWVFVSIWILGATCIVFLGLVNILGVRHLHNNCVSKHVDL